MTHASIDDFGPIHIGQDATASINVVDGDGDPLGLAGASVDALIVEWADRSRSTASILEDDLAVIHAEIDDGLSVEDESGGELAWAVDSDETEALADRSYHVRIRVEDAAGDVHPAAASGRVSVTPD